MTGHLPAAFIAFMVGVIFYLALLRAIRARLLILSKKLVVATTLLRDIAEQGKVASWDLMSKIIIKGEHKVIGDGQLDLLVLAVRAVSVINLALILFLIYTRPGG
jgi:hypothetical protein